MYPIIAIINHKYAVEYYLFFVPSKYGWVNINFRNRPRGTSVFPALITRTKFGLPPGIHCEQNRKINMDLWFLKKYNDVLFTFFFWKIVVCECGWTNPFRKFCLEKISAAGSVSKERYFGQKQAPSTLKPHNTHDASMLVSERKFCKIFCQFSRCHKFW